MKNFLVVHLLFEFRRVPVLPIHFAAAFACLMNKSLLSSSRSHMAGETHDF